MPTQKKMSVEIKCLDRVMNDGETHTDTQLNNCTASVKHHLSFKVRTVCGSLCFLSKWFHRTVLTLAHRNIGENVSLGLSNTNLDWVEIYEDIFKLSQEEEAGGHTLSSRNSVWNLKKMLNAWLYIVSFNTNIWSNFSSVYRIHWLSRRPTEKTAGRFSGDPSERKEQSNTCSAHTHCYQICLPGTLHDYQTYSPIQFLVLKQHLPLLSKYTPEKIINVWIN